MDVSLVALTVEQSFRVNDKGVNIINHSSRHTFNDQGFKSLIISGALSRQ